MPSIKGYYFSYNEESPDEILEYLKIRKKHTRKKRKRSQCESSDNQNIYINNKPKIAPDNTLKNIDQYDINGVFIKKWDSSKDIVKHYNMKNITPIIRVLRGTRKKFKNCIWRMEDYKPRKSWTLK